MHPHEPRRDAAAVLQDEHIVIGRLEREETGGGGHAAYEAIVRRLHGTYAA